MSPEEINLTIAHVTHRLRTNKSLQTIARNKHYSPVFPEKFIWEITPAQDKPSYIYMFTSFVMGKMENCRVTIHAKGTGGISYQSYWNFYFRNNANPFINELLPGLFEDFTS